MILSSKLIPFGLTLALSLSQASAAFAQDGEGSGDGLFGWVHGGWSLTLGVSGFAAPRYEGDDDYEFNVQPIISLGKSGADARFTSRNDTVSLSLYDSGGLRFGAAGKLIFERDAGDSVDLVGLDPIRFGGELGAFAEVYPTDWLRVRGELRQGIRSHDGIVGDLAADAFHDITPVLRLSGGPRLSFASSHYFDAYYGVDAAESAASGLAIYTPGGGMKSAGAGGAITWKATDTITASAFGEYSRLLGPAADSSLVTQRGSRDQFLFGLSTTYRFDFEL